MRYAHTYTHTPTHTRMFYLGISRGQAKCHRNRKQSQHLHVTFSCQRRQTLKLCCKNCPVLCRGSYWLHLTHRIIYRMGNSSDWWALKCLALCQHRGFADRDVPTDGCREGFVETMQTHDPEVAICDFRHSLVHNYLFFLIFSHQSN